MEPALKKFIKKILLFSTLLWIISFIIFRFALPEYYFAQLPFFFLIFIITSIFVHGMLIKAGKKRPTRFPTDFLLSVIIKLVAYSTSIGIFMYFYKSSIKPMTVTFLSLYFLYTFFEIRLILSDLNKKTHEK